jgi:hypothetical protein
MTNDLAFHGAELITFVTSFMMKDEQGAVGSVQSIQVKWTIIVGGQSVACTINVYDRRFYDRNPS